MLCVLSRGARRHARAHLDLARRGGIGGRHRPARARRGAALRRLRSGGSTMISRATVAASLVSLLVGGCGGSGPGAEQAAQVRALTERIAALEQRKARVEDVNAIERLQAAYGYYVDRALWDEVASLFAEDGTIEIG